MTVLEKVLYKNKSSFSAIVPAVAAAQVLPLDLSVTNLSVTALVAEDVALLATYIQEQLQAKHAIYGVGGYLEERNLYKRSSGF